MLLGYTFDCFPHERVGSGEEIISHHAKQLTLDRSRLQCRQEHIVSIDDKYTLRQVENTEYGIKGMHE